MTRLAATPPTLLACLLCLAGPCASAAGDFAYTFLEEPVSGEVDVRAEVVFPATLRGGEQARVVLCYLDDENHLYFTADRDGASLGKVEGGKDTVLARRAGWPDPVAGATLQVVVKRRDWRLTVLLDGGVFLQAYESYAPGERVGAAGDGLEVRDLHTQAIGELWFEDDFTRGPDEPDPWESAGGAWAVSLPEARDGKAQAARSANPFSLKALGEQGVPALAWHGASHWDGYRARVAVKPATPGWVGLACYLQDEENYMLFRVGGEADGAGRAELVRVAGGRETVLDGAPCSVRLDAWHELAIRASAGGFEGLLDGELLCTARDDAFGQGMIGLYTRDCERAYFDDVRVRPYARFTDSYNAAPELPVTRTRGRWEVGEGRLVGAPVGRGDEALALVGPTSWVNYRLAVDVLAEEARSIGVVFGYLGPTDYYLFRWGEEAGEGEGAVQELLRVTLGGTAVLDRRPAPLEAGRHYRIAATTDRAYLSVEVDGALALEAADVSRPSAGRGGFMLTGNRASRGAFDNLEVIFLDPPAEPVSITEQFAREDSMANWARPAASWLRAGAGLVRYSLPVWGDFALRIALPPHGRIRRDWSAALVPAGEGEGLDEAPAVLTVAGAPGVEELTVTAGEEVCLAQAGQDALLVTFRRRGACVIADVDGVPAAWARAADGDAAPAVGLRLSAPPFTLNDVTLTSPNIIDEAFATAPTDWIPAAGAWDISDRWHCSPQWSWLCGRDAETPLLWHKHHFVGDIVFEFWAAMMMDLTEAPHYKHPSDLNGVLYGDGRDIASGYAFVFAGDNNTLGKLLRRGEAVAESKDLVFINPVGANSQFHNLWFHCRAERTGSRLRFSGAGKPPLEYDDDTPLPGGHVGIWTHQGNGILVARARIAFRQRSR